MVVILRRVFHPMSAFRSDSPVAPSTPPLFGRPTGPFRKDGGFLVLQPMAREWAKNELGMGRELHTFRHGKPEIRVCTRARLGTGV